MVRSRGYFNRFGCDYIITDDDCRLMSIHSELTSTLYLAGDRAQRNQVHRSSSSSSGAPIQPPIQPYLNSLAKLSSMIASCNNYRRSYTHERSWLSPPCCCCLCVMIRKQPKVIRRLRLNGCIDTDTRIIIINFSTLLLLLYCRIYLESNSSRGVSAATEAPPSPHTAE